MVAAATWLAVLVLAWVLVQLVIALAEDFWVLVIAWSQP